VTHTIHLVDGTYELFRAYFGAPPARGPSGQEVGAVRGLARSLLFLLSDPDVTHVACAYDHVIESFRNELYHGYKTSEGVDPALLAQFPLAEEITEALGIVSWPMVEFEADDALATAASRLSQDPSVRQVVICTPDKDLAQCVVGERVVCLDRMRRKVMSEAGVIAKFGVGPSSIPDYLALVGDSADGIPGIPRWGPKSAATVLSRYGHLEAIPADGARWEVSVRGAGALAAALSAMRTEAMLYRRLATLHTEVPLAESLPDALRWRGPRTPDLERVAATLGDEGLLERAMQVASERLS
jgi:5'-3' exonuclease